MGRRNNLKQMKFSTALTIFAVGNEACAGGACSCPDAGFSKTTAVGAGTYCYKRFATMTTYEEAKHNCIMINENATFPHINTQDDLEDWTRIIGRRATWAQAEKRGWFGGSWRDWSYSKLRDVLWYEDLEDKGQDEPTKGDKFGYIDEGSVWGAAPTAEQSYYCVYNIDYLCNPQI